MNVFVWLGIVFLAAGALSIQGLEWLPYSEKVGVLLLVLGVISINRGRRKAKSHDSHWDDGGPSDDFNDDE